MESNGSGGNGELLDGVLSGKGQTILLIAVVANIVPAFLLRIAGGVMYSFFIVVFLWTALFIFMIVVALRIAENGRIPYFDVESPRSLILLLILTIAPRLAWIGTDVLISLDALWYIDFGKFMSWGQMPYADFYFPYPPVFGYFIYVIMLFAPAVDSYRLLAVVFDAAIVAALWQMVRANVIKDGLRIAPLVYAILPFAVIESGFNGHFEPIANIFLVLSLWCVLTERPRLGGVLLGISAATKVYAGFLLPVYLLIIRDNKKKIELISMVILTFYLTFIPFSIPVWLRGDLLLPGAAMPGLETGFFDVLFGFIFELRPLHILTISLVGVGALILIGFFTFSSLDRRASRVRTSLLYDAITLAFGILLVIMILLVWIYPLLPPGPGVFWRYPFDVALARGLTTSVGTGLVIWMAWRRWRAVPQRTISKEQLALIASVLLMMLLSLSKQVFYGWYLLWVIPPLLLVRDRRFVYIALACMLFLYPSYTHDNFLALGYEESKTWADEFNGVAPWTSSVNLNDTSLAPTDIDVNSYAQNGIGSFSVDATRVVNETALGLIEVVWARNVSISVTPQTELVVRISADWDPTFRRYCDFALYFDGLNSTGNSISWPIIDTWQFSPTNLTFVLWRFTFSGQGIQVNPVELTQLRMIVDAIWKDNLTIFIDTIYSTEVMLLTPYSALLTIILSMPNIIAVVFLERSLPRNEEWYLS